MLHYSDVLFKLGLLEEFWQLLEIDGGFHSWDVPITSVGKIIRAAILIMIAST